MLVLWWTMRFMSYKRPLVFVSAIVHSGAHSRLICLFQQVSKEFLRVSCSPLVPHFVPIPWSIFLLTLLSLFQTILPRLVKYLSTSRFLGSFFSFFHSFIFVTVFSPSSTYFHAYVILCVNLSKWRCCWIFFFFCCVLVRWQQLYFKIIFARATNTHEEKWIRTFKIRLSDGEKSEVNVLLLTHTFDCIIEWASQPAIAKNIHSNFLIIKYTLLRWSRRFSFSITATL